MVEVGTALLCIFNDRPMPGARESGKILFVTCWRCAEAPAPRLILGKMRMPAGWPAGWAGRSGAGGLGDDERRATGCSQPPGDLWVCLPHGTDPAVGCVWAGQRLGIQKQVPCPPAQSAKG